MQEPDPHNDWGVDGADIVSAWGTGPVRNVPVDDLHDLPGMWDRSDFLGGDPDERSHAERGWVEDYAWPVRFVAGVDLSDLEPVGYDGFGAPLYAHQIDPKGTE